MARLWSSGGELNSVTSDVEYTTKVGSGTVTLDTSVLRSGTYAVKVVSAAQNGGGVRYRFAASSQQGDFYFRGFFRIASTPDQQVRIFDTLTTGSSAAIFLHLNTDRTLQLYNGEDSANIGSASSALSTDTWYRIEIRVNTTTLASTEVDARIDGVSFVSGTVNLAEGIALASWGASQVSAAFTGTVYWDDLAINDNSGSFHNSWPGEGEIIHLRPNAAGDLAEWVDGTGSTYAEVDEVTPDDATTYIDTPDVDLISEFNLDATPAALESGDTINCVQVGVRFAQESAGTTSRIVVRIKAAASGTVEESSNITQSGTTWYTNSSSTPRNYPLTLYDLPGASTTAWTKADLDTTQIGVKRSVDDGLNSNRVSALWLLVDHAPAAAGPTLEFPHDSTDLARWTQGVKLYTP